MTALLRSKVALLSTEFERRGCLKADDPKAFLVCWQDKQIPASKRRLASNKHITSLAREHQTSVPLLADHNRASAVTDLADKRLGPLLQRAAPAVDLLDDE